MPEERQVTIQAETVEEYNERVRIVAATGIFQGEPTYVEVPAAEPVAEEIPVEETSVVEKTPVEEPVVEEPEAVEEPVEETQEPEEEVSDETDSTDESDDDL